MVVHREVIDKLEQAQESMQLVEPERNLVKTLKLRLLGLAAIKKTE
jgi:hypothetical protein